MRGGHEAAAIGPQALRQSTKLPQGGFRTFRGGEIPQQAADLSAHRPARDFSDALSQFRMTCSVTQPISGACMRLPPS